MASRPPALATHRSSRAVRVALLWLALVMAIAQTVAVRHAYSHSPDETTSQSAGKHPGGLAHCHSCIAAAAFGAAPPMAAALLLPDAAQHLPPTVTAAGQRVTPQQRPYAIRAPPSVAS